MNDHQPPDFLPMSDEEGYYIRSPKAVFNRTDEEFRVFDTHLLALAEAIKGVETALPPEQQALVQKLRDELGGVQDSTKLLLGLMRELAGYNVKLTEQRQSARASFNAGWEARYKDILSQLHPADHRMLRWIIEYLNRQEPGDMDIPY